MSSWFSKLKDKLSSTKDSFGKKVLGLFNFGKIDENLYEELEELLLKSDFGIHTSTFLLDKLREEVSLKGLSDRSELLTVLKKILMDILNGVHKDLCIEADAPYVMMVCGVNGAGKTTSIGKLTKYFQALGKTVILACADTFRAAADAQLSVWAKRNNVNMIWQQDADPAAVCFDAVNSATSKNIDIVIADTAGRLPNQHNLMEELKEIKRVITKAKPSAPSDVVLVLDATIGQNSISQVELFNEAVNLTGLIITKLDGTSKGGILFALSLKFKLPIYFIGIGEGVDDLKPFDAGSFVDAILQ